jgi:hypothetical protein
MRAKGGSRDGRGAAVADEPWRRGGGFRRLPEMVTRVLAPGARRQGLIDARLIPDWPTIVGPELGARCQPIKIARSAGGEAVLHLRASAAAALELQHREPQLIERINGYFGQPAVTRLRFVPAPRRPPPPAPPPPAPPVAPERVAAIEAAVCGVGAPELRTALRTLGCAVAGRAVADGRVGSRPFSRG